MRDELLLARSLAIVCGPARRWCDLQVRASWLALGCKSRPLLLIQQLIEQLASRLSAQECRWPRVGGRDKFWLNLKQLAMQTTSSAASRKQNNNNDPRASGRAGEEKPKADDNNEAKLFERESLVRYTCSAACLAGAALTLICGRLLEAPGRDS